jgi:hypothetical protein
MWILVVKYYIEEYSGVEWTSKYNIHLCDTKVEATKIEYELLELAEDNDDYKHLSTDIKEITDKSFTLTHERTYETISIDKYNDLISDDK